MTIEYNKVPASQAISWLSCGWKLFTSNPVIWIVMQVIFMVIAIVSGFIPFFGMVLFSLFAPVLGGGMIMAADKCNRGEPITINDLFAGFKDQRLMKNLLVVGVIGMLFTILSVMVGGVGMGGMMATMESGQAPNPGSMGMLGVGLILSMVVSVLWGMAAFFGVPLVALNGREPVAALKSSLRACLSNWLPLTIFGLIAMLLVMLGSIPFMLGLLIVLPFMFCAVYCAFKSIYSSSIPSSDIQM